MIKIMKQSGQEQTYLTEYIADTEEDVKNLPKEEVPAGSLCLVVATGAVYVLNTKSEWIKL